MAPCITHACQVSEAKLNERYPPCCWEEETIIKLLSKWNNNDAQM